MGRERERLADRLARAPDLSKRILLVARTSREAWRHDGLTMLEVPTDRQGGVEIRPIDTMGGREVNDVFSRTSSCRPRTSSARSARPGSR
jgi:hypothetical protein